MSPKKALLVEAFCGVLVAGLVAHAEEPTWEEIAAEQETVYVEEVAIDADGTVLSAMTGGSIVVQLEDGSDHVLDIEALEDPDGNQYYVAGGARQMAEEDPVTLFFRVVRYEPSIMSEEEVAAEWMDANPGATEDELQEFLAERSQTELPEIGRHVDPELQDWHSTANALETTTVVLILADQLPLDLPQAPNALLEMEPAFWFDAMETRLLAIEDRKTEIAAAQEQFIDDLEALGGTVVETVWLHNSLAAEVTPDVLAVLIDDPRVRSISTPTEVQLAWYDHDGVDAEEAIQTWMYLDHGYDGSHGTGRSSEDHVYILVADSFVDVDHPAWDYWDEGSQSYVSRCLGSFYWENDQWVSGSHTPTPGYWYKNHGNKVAATILADLTDGQDPSPQPPLSTAERAGISGIAPMPVFTFLEYQGDHNREPFTHYVQKAMELNVDIINFSVVNGGKRGEVCKHNQYYHESLEAVNDAMKDGIFVVQAAGNFGNGYDDPSFCSVTNPGGASGAFTVGALDSGDEEDLDGALIWNVDPCVGEPPPVDDFLPKCGSGRGGDVYGRPLIKVATPGGRAVHDDDFMLWPMYKNCNHPEYGTHTYWPTTNETCKPSGGGSPATSWATPVATGAAAELRDFMVQSPDVPWPHYLLVGHVFSHMLLMGDGAQEGDSGYEDGGSQTATSPIDELYGVGRLRMRLFTEAGMDLPWRWDFTYWVEDQGEVFYYPINEAGDVNWPVPTDAEWLRASLWWHEPNLAGTQAFPEPTSQVRFSIKADDGAPYYTCSSMVPQSQRLWLGNVLGGEAWKLRVYGLSIPPSMDPDYYHWQRKRGMYMAYYWEDRDRDDVDGPDGDFTDPYDIY